MKETDAKRFAIEKFSMLPPLEMEWNLVHARCMIRAMEDLAIQTKPKVDLEKMKALAWVHDIGKTSCDEGHALKSVEILEKEFKLDAMDKDCILNHGSTGKPNCAEAKLTQQADGLSLFYPEAVAFRFYAEAKEGSSYEAIREKMGKRYQKYVEVYSGSPVAIKLLREKYLLFFGE